jgi:cellulose 1,4-beta-cellobiosidase
MKATLIVLVSLALANAALTTNPWKNVDLFVNPDYVAEVETAIALYPEQQALLRSASRFSVAYWVDTMAKIPNVTRVLSNAKAAQQANGRPVLVEFVIYDLPNRDCAAAASNGEISCEDSTCANGLSTYKTQYIDPIVAAMAQFPDVTIVALVEPDSLPNLATNIDIQKCATARTAYMQGVAYAIQKLATLPNVAIYVDAAHGGWLGWPNNLQASASIFSQVLNAAGGANLIRGFATNTANYQPLGSTTSTADPCKLQTQYNQAIDEVHYVNLLNQALTSAGITGKGYIIDTSRNGVTNTRSACSNWCNIKGTGLGVRPTSDTAFTGLDIIDALHWGKVPGEADGTSDSSAPRYDYHCGSVDSVSGAPQAGQFWPSYFLALCQNAQPPLA